MEHGFDIIAHRLTVRTVPAYGRRDGERASVDAKELCHRAELASRCVAVVRCRIGEPWHGR